MRSNLETQLSHWDAADSVREELTTWLAQTLRRLEDNLQRFVHASDVKASLLKFQVGGAIV